MRQSLKFLLVAVMAGLAVAPLSSVVGQQLPPIVKPASSRFESTGESNPYYVPSGIIQEQEPKQDEINQVPIAPGSGSNGQIGPALEIQSNARNILGNGRNDWCNLPCRPDRLFGCTQNGFCIGGWAQAGYHVRGNGLFNTHPGRIHAQQIWVHMEKLTDPSRGMNWGFRADAVYGVDAQNIQAIGNSPPGTPDDWDNSYDNGIYGWALPQAYGEYSNGVITAKAGYFFAPMGNEPIAAVDNFFYSRTYARVLTRPTTMSGGLLELNQGGITWIGGAAMGWNSAFENIGDAISFVGGFRTTLANGARVTNMISAGETGIFGSAFATSTSVDMALTDTLTYSLYTDFYETDAFDDISITNQFVLQPNRCLGLGTRLEYYRTDRFGGDMSTWGWTTGLNIRPHQNIVVRPEVRLDWGPAATNSGQANYAVDAIMMF